MKYKNICMKRYSLRTSKPEDAEFLFKVKVEAMKPISAILRTEPFDYDKEFTEYLAKFEPEKIQVIEYEGKAVGRLRIVRTPESIYIGGVQILSEFQNKGIGTEIFNDVIEESKLSGIPVTLEVHHDNEKAISFYKKLGFKENGRTEKQLLMEYTSKNKTTD